MMSYKRWDRSTILESFLKKYTFIMNPERFALIYAPPLADEEVLAPDDIGVPWGDEDFDEVDRLVAEMENKRSLSGDELGPEEGWI